MNKKISDEYNNLVGGVANRNMTKLRDEVEYLKGYGFNILSTIGYGEGVFTITVTMVHPNMACVRLITPQSDDDGSEGTATFVPNGSKVLVDSYKF